MSEELCLTDIKLIYLFRDKTKENLVKNIKITGTNLTNEEIEEKIDSGDLAAFSSILQVEITLGQYKFFFLQKLPTRSKNCSIKLTKKIIFI